MNPVTEIAIAAIAHSTTNPRKTFDAAALAELTASIKAHGVLQPVLVRPMPVGAPRLSEDLSSDEKAWRVWSGKADLTGRLSRAKADAALMMLKNATHQLICGERRLRAATAAGLTSIPASVREMDDKQMLEVQVIENLQRADLHPLEEAEGYDRLTCEHNLTAGEIAARIGKSRSYVFGRMKLLDLSEKCREALWAGHISHSVALLIARIPDHKDQQGALDVVAGSSSDDGMSFRDAAHAIQRDYMYRLKDARFDPKDATLPGGPCAGCPKRTGNQKELFSDVSNADVCTDRSCFNTKRDLAGKAKLAKAEKAGATILDGAEAKKAFRAYGGVDDSKWVDLDATYYPPDGKARPWRKILGKHAPAPTVVVSPTGGVKELISWSAAAAALKAAGIKSPAGDVGRSDKDKERARLKALRIDVAARAVEPALVHFLPDKINTDEFWHLLALAAFDATDLDRHNAVAKRRGLSEKIGDARAALDKWLSAERTLIELQGFVFELLCLTRHGIGSWSQTWNEDFKATVDMAGIDLKKLEKVVMQEKAAKAPKKEKATK